MPTGYTSGVADGKVTTLEQFAWICARAFGALFHMRDEPDDAPITEPQLSSYHIKGLAEAKELQAWATAASEEDLRKRLSAEVTAEETDRLRREEERRLTDLRYLDMVRQVDAWRSPPELEPLRGMMLQQLRQSRDFDCGPTAPPKPRSLETFRGELLMKASRDIAYHSEQIRKEAERIEQSRQWIQMLRDSLPKEVKP